MVENIPNLMVSINCRKTQSPVNPSTRDMNPNLIITKLHKASIQPTNKNQKQSEKKKNVPQYSNRMTADFLSQMLPAKTQASNAFKVLKELHTYKFIHF